MAVLAINGVEEGSLGMVTTFCHHDYVKVEPPEVLSTLVQQDSPKPSVVVVKIFTNSPYLPQGSFSFPYLDVTSLSVGATTTQFPLAWLCLCRLPFILPLRLSCHIRGRKRGSKSIHSTKKHCGKVLRSTITCLILCCCQSPSSSHPYQEEIPQTEEGPSLSPDLMWLQIVTWAKAQLK